ncbi:MAG: integrating conjugative element protein [Gammaproteobacteria bacterium]|nr:integrating conjugative element protein [Gammaproteobacteria bacterium]
MKWLSGFGVLIAGLPILASAAPTVIHDSGDTRSIAPFLEAFETSEITPPQNQTTQRLHLGAADPVTLLPIRSPGLTPGPVEPKSHDRPFTRPFFLIGSDPHSRQWLLQHRDRLEEIGAVGMLVQADTPEDLRAIAGLTAGLPVMPASASDIAKALGIAHYPVLIGPRGIEQ